MCGIAGILDQRGNSVSRTQLARMNAAIAHRGPDGQGYYVDGSLGLAHNRLAILDLSPAGHQPFASADQNLVLIYNGEIFNYLDLRTELRTLGYTFRSQTDTESLLHALHAWGEDCLPRLNGMFAFAYWNKQKRELTLARDRFGVKPLYYYHRDGLFLFASEIKAILTHPEVTRQVCPQALGEYFTFQNIFTDRTLFEGIHLLPPGSVLKIREGTRQLTQTRYWEFQWPEKSFEGTYEDAVEQTYHLFQQAVTRQLVSDVPVGSYLSGGMDSGSITGVAAKHLGRVHTFTGGFDLSSASGLELAFDERPASEIMANLFKTEHYEMVLHAGDMEHILPKLIWHLEDLRVGQCYPNYYVARLASKFVKVVLSGAGGDELFAGYPWRYYRGRNAPDAQTYSLEYYQYWQRLISEPDRASFFQPELHSDLAQSPPADIFREVFSTGGIRLDTLEERIHASLLFELKTFLHGLLVVEDKLSMAHGLETRVPFLDNDLVDFALSLPVAFKLRDLQQTPEMDEDTVGKRQVYRNRATADGKLILRDAMQRIIPDAITQRAKQGFSAPDASWFRGESINYVNRVLRNPRARLFEYLQQPYVERILDQHTSGTVNHRLLIWSLLSFETWLQTFIP